MITLDKISYKIKENISNSAEFEFSNEELRILDLFNRGLNLNGNLWESLLNLGNRDREFLANILNIKPEIISTWKAKFEKLRNQSLERNDLRLTQQRPVILNTGKNNA